ncbi:MAG: lipopolysaccharide biosynthesis protein [Ectothiorhodospiraceae bacterium]
MTLRRSATNAAFWGLAQKWGHHSVKLLVFVALARLLEPESFGLVALASVFVLLGETLVDQGFSDALVQRRALGRAHCDAAFWASAFCGVALCTAFVVAAPPLAAVFGQPRLGPVLAALSPALLLVALGKTHEALLRRRLAFKPIAGIAFVAVVAGGLTGLGMAISGYGVWSLVGQQLVQRLVQLPCLWFVSRWRPRARFSVHHFRSMLRFGASIIGINLVNFANRQSDHLLIGYVLGPTALGYYTVGYRLLRMLLELLPHALVPVAFSAFSRMGTDRVRMREALYEATRVVSLAAFPAFCGLVLVAPELIPSAFGANWRPSVPVLQALAPIGLLQSVSLFYPAALKACGRPGWVLLISGVNAVANVLAFAVVVPWGITAVAMAFTVRGFLLWPMSWWAINRVLALDVGRYARALVPAVTGSAVMALVVVIGKATLPGGIDGAAVVGFAVAIGAASYAAAVFTLAPTVFRETLRLVNRRHST